MNLKEIRERFYKNASMNGRMLAPNWVGEPTSIDDIEYLLTMLEEAEDFAIWSTGFDPGMSEEMLRQGAETAVKKAQKFLSKIRGE